MLNESFHRLAKEAMTTQRKLTRLENAVAKFVLHPHEIPSTILQLMSKKTIRDLPDILKAD